MKKYKILFYIKDPNGGTGKFLEHIYKGLANYPEFEVKILTHITPHNYDFVYDQVGHQILKQGAFSLNPFLKSIQNFIDFVRYVQKYSPDIIYSFDIYANIATNLLKLFKNRIYVINSSNVNITKHIETNRKSYFTTIIRSLILWLYPKSDAHVVPAYGLKKELIQKYNIQEHKIYHIVYPLDIDKVKKLAKAKFDKKVSSEYVYITTMVRNDAQKDIFSLLKVIQSITKKRANIIVRFLGIDRIPLDISKHFPHSFIKKNVQCLIWQKNPYIYIKNSDIFILLSQYEGLPYSLIEAQSLGVPVLASDVDFGPREIIQHKKNGILLKNNKVTTVTSYLNKILEDKDLRNSIGRNAKKISKKYDQQLIVPLYISLFKSFQHSAESK